MMGLRYAGHCRLAVMLQILRPEHSSLDFEDNRGLALRNYIGARPKVAKAQAALLVLGLLLAFGHIDQAGAQQQLSPPGQGLVQVVPQTPGYQAPKPYQVTPQTPQPTPMYPQYQVTPQTSQPTQQKGNAQ